MRTAVCERATKKLQLLGSRTVLEQVLLIVDLRAQINEKMLHLKLDLKFCSQSTLNFSKKVTQNTFIPNIETDCGQFLGTRVMRRTW